MHQLRVSRLNSKGAARRQRRGQNDPVSHTCSAQRCGLKGVPLFSEALKDESSSNTYKAYMAQMEYQRPITVAPGTSMERLEILRRAFKATLTDPEFQAQAANQTRNHLRIGREIDRIVAEVLSISPRVKNPVLNSGEVR